MLESSSKWPDDIEAIRRLKAAFHIELARAIQNNCDLPVKVSATYIDVLKVKLSTLYPRLLKSTWDIWSVGVPKVVGHLTFSKSARQYLWTDTFLPCLGHHVCKRQVWIQLHMLIMCTDQREATFILPLSIDSTQISSLEWGCGTVFIPIFYMMSFISTAQIYTYMYEQVNLYKYLLLYGNSFQSATRLDEELFSYWIFHREKKYVLSLKIFKLR